jgi:hypothetical protein
MFLPVAERWMRRVPNVETAFVPASSLSEAANGGESSETLPFWRLFSIVAHEIHVSGL